MNTEIDLDAKELEREIKRLSKMIGNSYDFGAAAWAIQTLVNEYEKVTGEEFNYD